MAPPVITQELWEGRDTAPPAIPQQSESETEIGKIVDGYLKSKTPRKATTQMNELRRSILD